MNGKHPRELPSMSHVIPKRKVSVHVVLETGENLRGNLFLDFIDVIHRGEQTILDKLNDDYPWFALALEDGPVSVVNRSKVVLVEPGAGVVPRMVRNDNSPVFRRERVTLKLAQDRTLVGQLAMDLPDEFSRVSDFLNFPQNFFALETDEGPVLVSKDHVVTLYPHEKPPAMPAVGGRENVDRA